MTLSLYPLNELSRPYALFVPFITHPHRPPAYSSLNCGSTHFSPFTSMNVIINSLSFSLHSGRLCLALAFHRPQFRSCPVRINALSSPYRHIIYHQTPSRFDQFLSICTHSIFSCVRYSLLLSLFSCISTMSFTHNTLVHTGLFPCRIAYYVSRLTLVILFDSQPAIVSCR